MESQVRVYQLKDILIYGSIDFMVFSEFTAVFEDPGVECRVSSGL